MKWTHKHFPHISKYFPTKRERERERENSILSSPKNFQRMKRKVSFFRVSHGQRESSNGVVFFFVEFECVLLHIQRLVRDSWLGGHGYPTHAPPSQLVQELSDVVRPRAREFLQLSYDFVFCAGNSIASSRDRFFEEALAEAFEVLTGVLVARFQQEGSGKVDSEVATSDRFISDKELINIPNLINLFGSLSLYLYILRGFRKLVIIFFLFFKNIPNLINLSLFLMIVSIIPSPLKGGIGEDLSKLRPTSGNQLARTRT